MRGTGTVRRAAGLLTKGRRRLASQGGFTLVELIVVSMILFMLTVIILNFMEEGTAVTRGGVAGAEVDQELRETIESMSRQIRVAYYFVPAGTTSSQVDFYGYVQGDNTKWHVLYYLDAARGELIRSAAPVGSNMTSQVIATGVRQLTFTYYDSEGAVTADPTKIARVEFTLTLRRDYTGTQAVGTNEPGVMTETGKERYIDSTGTGSVYIRNALATAP
jgi:type II secretory pathway component PulJ